MPLSEHEQHLLEQMEQAMSVEDPKFASAMRGRSPRARHHRRLLLGGVGLVVGLVLVVIGVAQGAVALSVAGFVLMLAGGAFAAAPERRSGPVGAVDATGQTQPRRGRPARSGRSTPGPRTSRSHAGFMERLEQRWDRRRDGGWGA